MTPESKLFHEAVLYAECRTLSIRKSSAIGDNSSPSGISSHALIGIYASAVYRRKKLRRTRFWFGYRRGGAKVRVVGWIYHFFLFLSLLRLHYGILWFPIRPVSSLDSGITVFLGPGEVGNLF